MNESFQLNCTASTNMYDDISWLKDGHSFKPDTQNIKLKNYYVDNLKNSMVSFARLEVNNSGNYTCVGHIRRGGTSRTTSVLLVKGNFFKLI